MMRPPFGAGIFAFYGRYPRCLQKSSVEIKNADAATFRSSGFTPSSFAA